jgi:rhamnogalacturonyl hydrolase YesR
MTKQPEPESVAVLKAARLAASTLQAKAGQIPADPYTPTRWGRLVDRLNSYLSRAGQRLIAISEQKDFRRSWFHCCFLLALVAAHRAGDAEALDRLRAVLARQFAADGSPRFRLIGAFQAMGGYPLCYAAERTDGDARFAAAARRLRDFLCSRRRAANGAILYSDRTDLVLVDLIGMACPFLAVYARLFRDDEAMQLCRTYVEEFWRWNVDPETGLPFHGYKYGAATGLGLKGWGRGVGWYTLGLVDTWAELSDAANETFRRRIADELRRVFATLARWQRTNGHWGEQIEGGEIRADSSATAFVAYAFVRAARTGMIGEEFDPVIRAALAALAQAMTPDGRIRGSSAEAKGLGIVGVPLGAQPWTDALAAAALLEAGAFPRLRGETNERG